MKRKIVIKLWTNCDKCRKKAMKIVATAAGVSSVSLQGDEKEKMEVVGEGIDATSLTYLLRKKACPADIEIIEEVKPEPEPEPKPEPDKPIPCPCPPIWCPQSHYDMCKVIYEPYSYGPSPGCRFM